MRMLATSRAYGTMHACSSVSMTADDDSQVDSFVRSGDASACVLYGAVQTIVDFVLGPIVAENPELFVTDQPVSQPVAQGAFLALAWLLCGTQCGAFRASGTRSVAGAKPVALTWLSSSALMLAIVWALQAGVGLGPGASEAEISFVTGSLTVVGAWRFVCLQLPPL